MGNLEFYSGLGGKTGNSDPWGAKDDAARARLDQKKAEREARKKARESNQWPTTDQSRSTKGWRSNGDE